ncbi:MAG: cysteine peptidase family C39 domain-containing protein [Chitinophagaceae bacterium]
MHFTFYRQYNGMDCGPTCLRMVVKHFKKTFLCNTVEIKHRLARKA